MATAGHREQVVAEDEHEAVQIIWDAWCRYRDRRWYFTLKRAIQEAEHSVSSNVLRQLMPVEANLLGDKAMGAKVRFRLIGGSFPPGVVFKVFVSSGHRSAVQYFSGKELIRPASEAAQDALLQMGARTFQSQMADDEAYEEAIGMNSMQDAVTPQETMRYRSLLDDQQACDGGTENCWRHLSLDVFLRTITGQPVYQHRGLRTPARLSRKFISDGKPCSPSAHALRNTPSVLPSSVKARPSVVGSHKPRLLPSQATKQKRLDKLRQLYGLVEKTPENIIGKMKMVEAAVDDGAGHGRARAGDMADGSRDEADELYVWSQELRVDDIDVDF